MAISKTFTYSKKFVDRAILSLSIHHNVIKGFVILEPYPMSYVCVVQEVVEFAMIATLNTVAWGQVWHYAE
jgi:hypothetical protein